MSPASNSKLKDKSTSKPVKEPKAHSSDRSNDLLEESEYNPAIEYDSASNIDSLPREYNDLQKDRNNASYRTNSIPGSDPTKQEKIMLRNEKKHQKRKEKRAQELQEKCCSYLTSRKLDSLAQHLASMGFTSEAATAALIQNEGRLEASASWILDGGIERTEHSELDTSNKKIDISDELSRIKVFESRFKCSKLDVQKAVVACEGDLQKAEEALKAQFEKPEASAVSESVEESRNEPTLSPASEKTLPVHYTKPKYIKSTQVYRPVKKAVPSTAASATATQVNQNAVPPPPEKRGSVSTTMGTPLQQMQSSESAIKSNTDTNTQDLYFHDQYHHMPYVPSLNKPPEGGFRYNNIHGTSTSRSSLPPSGSSVLASEVDWGSQKDSIPFCDYTNIDWSLDSSQIGLPPSSIKGERLYDKALRPSQFSSKLDSRKSGSHGGENRNFTR